MKTNEQGGKERLLPRHGNELTFAGHLNDALSDTTGMESLDALPDVIAWIRSEMTVFRYDAYSEYQKVDGRLTAGLVAASLSGIDVSSICTAIAVFGFDAFTAVGNGCGWYFSMMDAGYVYNKVNDLFLLKALGCDYDESICQSKSKRNHVRRQWHIPGDAMRRIAVITPEIRHLLSRSFTLHQPSYSQMVNEWVPDASILADSRTCGTVFELLREYLDRKEYGHVVFLCEMVKSTFQGTWTINQGPLYRHIAPECMNREFIENAVLSGVPFDIWLTQYMIENDCTHVSYRTQPIEPIRYCDSWPTASLQCRTKGGREMTYTKSKVNEVASLLDELIAIRNDDMSEALDSFDDILSIVNDHIRREVNPNVNRLSGHALARMLAGCMAGRDMSKCTYALASMGDDALDIIETGGYALFEEMEYQGKGQKYVRSRNQDILRILSSSVDSMESRRPISPRHIPPFFRVMKTPKDGVDEYGFTEPMRERLFRRVHLLDDMTSKMLVEAFAWDRYTNLKARDAESKVIRTESPSRSVVLSELLRRIDAEDIPSVRFILKFINAMRAPYAFYGYNRSDDETIDSMMGYRGKMANIINPNDVTHEWLASILDSGISFDIWVQDTILRHDVNEATRSCLH